MSEPPPTPARAPKSPDHGDGVLVIDDDPVALLILRQMLLQRGIASVQCCDGAAAALAWIDGGRSPSLILCDLNMPGIDGIEFLRELVRRHYRGEVALVSGEDERVRVAAERLVRAHTMTLLGTLAKPVRVDDLARLLASSSHAPQRASARRRVRRRYAPDRLRAALEDGEILVHYQPKVDVATGEVVGLEALVRWEHPEDGLVMPDAFVGVAENHGLIDALTRIVLDDAANQTAAWQAVGLSLPVSVNVSMKNLAALDFPDVATAQVHSAGVVPQDVVFEVTESRLMTDLRGPLDVLTRLRMRRFGLAIDDFGTGHSSLSQLRDLPFDELKIDRGFVHGADRDATVRALFDASWQLGRQLGMNLVAEGVEDRADWDFVRGRDGCHAQGWFIAKAMPAQAMPAWCDDWRRRVRDEALCAAA